VGAQEAEYSDLLIIGAGISGIGAAYRIPEKNPKLSYTVLERRQRIGGTWDLFRYPGIRGVDGVRPPRSHGGSSRLRGRGQVLLAPW
jgi:cation diffusion facilitator CzcD-associated flavoprotein CzcO